MTTALDTFQSRAIIEAEKKCLKTLFSRIRGYYLLLVGHHRKLIDLPDHSLYALRISPVKNTASQSYIVSEYNTLALRNNCLDVVILSYLLEYCENPEALLNELHRCLIGEGKIFLFGFHQLHPWCWFNAPKPRQYINLWIVKSLLDKVGFSITHIGHMHYGAIYYIEAQKHIRMLTPIRPQWELTPLEKAWIEPTVRQSK